MRCWRCVAWVLGLGVLAQGSSCKSRLVIGALGEEDALALPTTIVVTPAAGDTETPAAPSLLPVDAGPAPTASSADPVREAGASVVPAPDGAVDEAENPLIFSTSFEDDFAAYDDGGGGCFASPTSSYASTPSPVRSGARAAAFQAGADGTEDGYMAHCFRHVALPLDAYYGAWFLVPAEVTSAYVWALMHFDGEGPDVQHELWDVRLEPTSDGSLEVSLFDYLRMETRRAESGAVVPVGTWFHLEVHWLRATDETGAFELFVDGRRVVGFSGVTAEALEPHEWYVGNFAALTVPRPSTVLVDDVTLASTRVGVP